MPMTKIKLKMTYDASIAIEKLDPIIVLISIVFRFLIKNFKLIIKIIMNAIKIPAIKKSIEKLFRLFGDKHLVLIR